MHSSIHSRLLFRGSLSLPDSHLPLDGLTFLAATGTELLQNPLALALESMRGRPSLRFLGTTPLEQLSLDVSGGVCVNVHPHAMLSRIYFENVFCHSPLPQGGRSEHGIRVALGDSDGPETTEIVIYAQCTNPSPTTTPLQQEQEQPPLTLQVARIIHAAPSLDSHASVPRLPRPDDPTPRLPPSEFVLQPHIYALKKRAKAVEEDASVRRAREVMLHLPRSGKVDALGAPPVPPSRKGKERAVEDPFTTNSASEEVEKANKLMIKKSAMRALSSRSPSKHDAEFKELFGFVYRGAAFALREQLRSESVDLESIDRVVDAHVCMYVRGADAGVQEGMVLDDSEGAHPRLPGVADEAKDQRDAWKHGRRP